MQRAGNVARSKKDRHEIEESFKESPHSEFCLSVFSCPVLDNNFANAIPLPMCEHRNVPVEFAVHVHTLHHVSPVCFQAAIEIVDLYPRHKTCDKIEKFRGNCFRNRVPPFFLPTGDDVEPQSNLPDQIWNFGGVVLQICIHRHDKLTLSTLKAHHERS